MENTNNNEKWIKDTALLFYQIFSVDYKDTKFLDKLLSGGGGNSTLCSTWTHLNRYFVTYRISENAYKILLEKISEEDKDKIKFDSDVVYISPKITKKYYRMFYNNAKGAKNRVAAGKYFHFDHNPSNKKVLELLNSKIKKNKDKEGFLEELTEYIKTVQTIDLITVQEDEKRTSTDLSNPTGPFSSDERDKLLNTKFYSLK